ncbi:MAG: PDZ domain-containing protein [Gemmataceae bacterium]
MRIRADWVTLLGLSCLSATQGQEKGFQPERRVRAPSRIEWEFATDPGTAVPASYDSRRQRYQLYVPGDYAATRAWPLVVSVPPGDDPTGWRAWKNPCEDVGCLFASPFAAGNACPPAQRLRLVLDVLDDVRREYRIDPEQTYLVGQGGGVEPAARLAVAFPEYVAGLVAIGADVPLPGMPHLRYRMRDRLSVALIAGKADPARARQEKYLIPLLDELGVRSKFWLEDDGPGRLPSPKTLAEVLEWLRDDLKRRRADAETNGLDAAETPTRRQLAERSISVAERELGGPAKLARAAARLEWVAARCGEAPGTEKAAELLRRLKEDDARSSRLLKQTGAELRAHLRARARALEGLGDFDASRRAWNGLALLSEGDEAKAARAGERRVAGQLALTPYLGITFAASTTTVKGVAPGGPADLAGVQAGDDVEAFDKANVATLGELRERLRGRRPGEELPLGVRRAGKPVTLTVRLGALPAEG